MAFRRALSLHRILSSAAARLSCPAPPAPLSCPTPPAPQRCERRIFQSASPTLGLRSLERFCLLGLAPSPPLGLAAPEAEVSIEVARKLVRAAQMERARERLRGLECGSVPYNEFLRVCAESAGDGEGGRLAGDLHNSGFVIIIGDNVVLRPDEIMKAIEKVIASPSKEVSHAVAGTTEEEREELKSMEEKKSEIDKTAEKQVQRELHLGLGLFAAQTLGFMRLTFWELSWDVMEPVCFFMASLYFILGYAFFLRTSTEPTFEGIFKSRFAARQRRLMRQHGFDLAKLEALRSRSATAGLLSLRPSSPSSR